MRGTSSYRVRVNKNWFTSNNSDNLKPTLSNSNEKFDFQLFPTKNILYALYYRALKDYTFQLEANKEKWFNEPRWGMKIDEKKGIFVWKGDNNKQFPVTPIQCLQAFSIREKQYLIQSQSAT